MPTTNPFVDYWTDAWQRWLLTLDVLRQRGNIYHEHNAQNVPNVLSFKGTLVLDGRTLERAGELHPGAYRADRRQGARSGQTAVRRRRSARRSRTRHRWHEAGQRDRRGARCGSPLLLRRLPARAHARPDDRGRVPRRGALPRGGGTPPSRGPRQAGGDRQLPGRLADDDDGGAQARATRPDRAGRLAAFLLGGRARQEPDALPGWAVGWDLADLAGR